MPAPDARYVRGGIVAMSAHCAGDDGGRTRPQVGSRSTADTFLGSSLVEWAADFCCDPQRVRRVARPTPAHLMGPVRPTFRRALPLRSGCQLRTGTRFSNRSNRTPSIHVTVGFWMILMRMVPVNCPFDDLYAPLMPALTHCQAVPKRIIRRWPQLRSGTTLISSGRHLRIFLSEISSSEQINETLHGRIGLMIRPLDLGGFRRSVHGLVLKERVR